MTTWTSLFRTVSWLMSTWKVTFTFCADKNEQAKTKAIKTLASEGIRTNCTLCFSPAQAILVAKAGATYISPFIGRLDDISHNGMDLIEQIVTIYDNYGFETQVLAASIRHPLHVVEAALVGAHVATIPFDVIKKLVAHPLTTSGLEKFLDDWRAYEASLA